MTRAVIMTTGRMEAFSDGVLAIIITIMVLELKAPEHAAEFGDLTPLTAALLSYVLSFVYIGIFWVNHHHLLHATRGVTGAILWANMHLLFWISLIPFATAWMGTNDFAPAPTATYGVVLLCAGAAYLILERTIVGAEGADTALAKAVGRDRKAMISVAIYAAAIPAAFVSAWIAGLLYALVAALWLVPDRRIERALARGGE